MLQPSGQLIGRAYCKS